MAIMTTAIITTTGTMTMVIMTTAITIMEIIGDIAMLSVTSILVATPGLLSIITKDIMRAFAMAK